MLGRHQLVVRPRFFHERLLDPRINLGRPLRRPGHFLPHTLNFLRERLVLVRTRLLIDFVTRTVRPQTCHRAIDLEQLKLRLIQFRLELAQLPIGDGHLAVALLEHGITAAEQTQLHLLVLRPGVHLCRHLAELHFNFTEIVPRRGEPVVETAAADLCEIGRIFRRFLLRTQIKYSLLGILHALVESSPQRFFLVQLRLLRFQTFAPRIRLGPQRDHFDLQCSERRTEFRMVVTAPRQREVPQTVAESFVAHGLRCLPTQRPDLPPHLADHVRHSRHVGVRQRQFLHGLAPRRFILRDSRRFLEHRPALLRF